MNLYPTNPANKSSSPGTPGVKLTQSQATNDTQEFFPPYCSSGTEKVQA